MAETEDLRLSSKTVCVVDNGLFPELALQLSKTFGRTLYWSSWKAAFPRSRAVAPGEGLEGVERIRDIEPSFNEIDLYVFPDVFYGTLQVELRQRGKRVWGSALGDRLELERAQSKKWLKQLGLPVGPYQVIRGTMLLRDYLQKHGNVYVKSNYRGDMETFHASEYALIEPRLDELEHALGARKHITEFVVEDHIESSAEVGFDGYTIDGQFARSALHGIETKDAGYIGQVTSYAALPRALAYINSRLSPLFRNLQYRGFWSSEVRVALDGTPYLIDPCCRMASPPGELYSYLIENLSEIVWEGSAGKLVEPRWRHDWGAQLVLQSSWAEHGWQPIEFPDEYRENVKIHYLTVIDGKHYYVPQETKFPEIGSVVAGGNTKQEAIKAVIKIAEQVKGYDIKFNAGALEEAAASMDKLRAA